jgi:hypothetical protein
MEELDAMMASIPADWAQVAPIDYLKTFVRQASVDFFFESLVENTRLDMLNLQMHIKTVESMQRKEWTSEVTSLKRENYEGNIDRIIHLEGKLNDASERYITDRLSNYVKHDTLNSEKMTPHFLRIAEKRMETDLSNIRQDDGTVFGCEQKRNEDITRFYETLYKNPPVYPITLKTLWRIS